MSSGVIALVRHARTASAATIDWKMTRPSVEPISGSVARSGCGIMPMHVALAVEHAGDVAQRAVGIVDVAEGDAIFGFELVERALVGDSSSLRRARSAGAASGPCAPRR